MGKYSKLREKIFSGTADSNIDFGELCQVKQVRRILVKYQLGESDVD